MECESATVGPRAERGYLPTSFIQKLRTATLAVSPTMATVFGSSVTRGLAAKDVDVLVVADAFQGLGHQHRTRLLRLPDGPTYDLWCLTPAEYDARKTTAPWTTAFSKETVSLWP